MYLPGYTYHLVQRGNNREACFFEPENYLVYLKYMREVLPRYGNQLHAYCLMTNHVHFLITPRNETSISALLKVVCSRYGQYINKKYSRSGTLWEGRHKASAVDTENYLLKCYRYIELNPVVAGLVTNPREYPWSSYHCNALGDPNPVLSHHEYYQQLGANEFRRCSEYRNLFLETLSVNDMHKIQKAAHYSMPVGSDRFVAQIERTIGRKLGYIERGRPPSRLVKN